jgi:dTDP-glucose pyrophosphorylase
MSTYVPSDVTVILLAGGKGTRVNDIAPDTPKPLLEIDGIPALIMIVRQLVRQGFRKFVVVVNPSNEKKIRKAWRDSLGGIVSLHFTCCMQVEPRGPAHALLCGLKKIGRTAPVLVCLADTLFTENIPLGEDWVGTSFETGGGKWCWVETKGRSIVRFYDKIQPPASVRRVLIGLYYFLDSDLAYRLLQGTISSVRPLAEGEYQLSQLLDTYRQHRQMFSVDIKSWVDCGSVENYEYANEYFLKHRCFNSINISRHNGASSVFKHGMRKKIQDELFWIGCVSKRHPTLTPKILESEDRGYRMTQVRDPLLSSVYLYHPQSPSSFVHIMRKLLREVQQKLWNDAAFCFSITLAPACESMYVTKPFRRLFQWKSWSRFICPGASITINGVRHGSLEALFRRALSFSASRVTQARATAIHGDFHFGNIFYGNQHESFTFIDPRGSFGNIRGVLGDVYYDLGKLRHSYHGMFDAITDGLFTLETSSKNSFSFSLGPRRDAYIKRIDALIRTQGYDMQVVKSVELGILLSLIPLHEESPLNQLAFFIQAVLLAKELEKPVLC